jgi:MFS transporter, ACS family, hexuronate transporter
MKESAPGSAPAVSKHRWVILALLFFATTINYIDRSILSLLKPMLDDQFRWSNEEFGRLTAAFQGAYALGLLGFGWFIDRFGVKIGYSASILFWSLAAAAHALVGSVTGFRWARLGLGLGEGGNFPAAIKTVAQWFPRGERAFANALFNSGSNIGSVLAPAIILPMAVAWGWRSTFIFAGILGIVWLFFWFPLFREAPVVDGEEEPTEKVAWVRLLGTRQAWAYMVAKFLTDPVWWFYLTWLPDYFKKEQHLDLKSSILPLVTLYSIVTVLSILAGWVVKKLAAAGHDIVKVRKVSMFIFAVCSLPIFFVRGLGMWEAVLLIAFAASAHQAWSASLYATVSDTFPKQAISSVSGLGGFVGSLGGMAFPIVAGKLLDADPVNGYGILFSICAFAYVLAFALHHILVPKLEMANLGTDESGASYSIASMVLSTLGLAALFISFSEGVAGRMAFGGLLFAIAGLVFSKMGEKSEKGDLAGAATLIGYVGLLFSAYIFGPMAWAWLVG